MTIDILESTAKLYWPAELVEKTAEVSSLIPLLETQDMFISFLGVANKTPTSWKEVLQHNKDLSPNLFLKHLMVLSDIGGERLQRFSTNLPRLFPESKFTFLWNGDEFTYEFQSIGKLWTNKVLRVEKSVLLENRAEFTSAMVDVAMLLMWAGSIKNAELLPAEMMEKCIIGTMLGNVEELEKYIKQRYILVSRQTGGSTANDLGHVCEEYVKEKLEEILPSTISVKGHHIPGVSHNDNNLSTFDLVARGESGQYVGIEISFQVTTNSTIERKAGLAKSRRDLVNNQGHKIAYIIDGAGNFQRRNAIKTIYNNSDCTVNFSDEDLAKLATFIIEVCG